MKLIYHNIESNNDYSPFDRELIQLAKEQNLYLVSPYIGIAYLNRLIKISKSWQLITDFEAWIISHPTKNERLKIYDFIKENFDKIKHFPDIHAKVMLTDCSAYIGSSNFTNKGILERTEMSISLSEQKLVEELRNWFQSMWNDAIKIPKDNIYDFIIKNENVDSNPKIERIINSVLIPKRKSKLIPIEKQTKTQKPIVTEQEDETNLIKAIKTTKKDKIWLNKYFDIVRGLFIDLEISEDSPKIAMSVTKDFKMPISVGQRYIIALIQQNNMLGFILPIGFREIMGDYTTAIIDETYFFKNGTQDALWVEFESDIIF